MLQIIIWMGCVYLIFKGWQMKQFCDAHFPEEHVNEGNDTWTKGQFSLASATIVAIIFFILSLTQTPDIPSL